MLADVEKVCSEVQRKAIVKKSFTLSRDTNGPYKGTVHKKTQDSLLLRNGMNRLIKISVLQIFCSLTKVELLTLLSLQVEALTSVT